MQLSNIFFPDSTIFMEKKSVYKISCRREMNIYGGNTVMSIAHLCLLQIEATIRLSYLRPCRP